MTVRVDTPSAENWRNEEDDYGDPMVFHRHVGDEAPAYIIGRGSERQWTQCSSCMEYLDLVGTPAAIARD